MITHFGGVVETAKALKISRQAVMKWPDLIPEGSAYKCEVLTHGALRVNPADYLAKASVQARVVAA